jgi:two-component system cell cycle response regulator DivK
VGQKILVVEDNELNLRLFCDLLRAHGYEAEAVRDGREAIERARAFAPDLVVMDIQMPHISGLELIERMKADAELRRPPIMAVTAYAAKGDEERIRDAGAEGYVSKPISVLKFVEAVRALLDAAAARAAEEGPAAEEEAAEEESETEDASPRPFPGGGRGPGAEGDQAEPAETQEAAEPEGEAAAGETLDDGPSRHSRESGNPPSDGGDDGQEEGRWIPDQARDDAGPKGETP